MSSRLFPFPSVPKFKDELKMPFTKSQPEALSALRDLASGWEKIVTQRAVGDEGPGLDLAGEAIAFLIVDVGQDVVQGIIAEALQIPFQRLGDQQPYPHCSRPGSVPQLPRTLTVRGDTIGYDEPVG
jgi:hypothetical protein